MRRVWWMVAAAAIVGCRSTPERPDRRGGPDYLGEGLASFYGAELHGRKTASGEIFDKDELTAAHRKLKFGSCVRVVNLKNGRAVKVRVNDRGPFSPGRVIDVSEAAARELDMIRSGVVRVRLYRCG